MKYIRTKDIEEGIGELDELMEIAKIFEIKDADAILYLNSITVKQANTIPELCDAIIYFEDDGKPETTEYFGNMITFKGKIEFLKKMGHKDFKLGIWTDKGLIYEAKMKGILPNGEIDWELL